MKIVGQKKAKYQVVPSYRAELGRYFVFLGVRTMRKIAKICEAFTEKLSFKKGTYKQDMIDTVSSENKPPLATKK